MGWDWGYETKSRMIERLTKDAIARRIGSSRVWIVMPGHDGEPVIILLHVKQTKDMAGYKEVSESMGPYDYDCPLRFLELAPVKDEAWRTKVRRHHEIKQHKWKPGERVLVHGKPYTLIRKLEGKWHVCAADGTVYRVSTSNLRPVPVEEPA